MSSDQQAETNTEDSADDVNSPDAEILEEEPRNLLLALVSQIRPGMDLSKITLPTFILEPRSMLEKLTDFMTHGELLTVVPKMKDPVERMVGIVKWYLSGFYIKPQGVKKPYNPILGEYFRTKWNHEDGTTTHYVAEQTSHHPPISSLYISNRKAGFVINGSIFPRSKFLRISVASFLDGTAILTLLETGEVYTITFPTVYGRGIIVGTLLMELCGNVSIHCHQTHIKADIDFKEKGFFGEYNVISGKITQKKDVLYTLSGKWDGRMDITNAKTKKSEVLWDSKDAKRVPKVTRPLDQQDNNESQKLWLNVTNAIKKRDQKDATAEKTKLEDAQRARKEKGDDYAPRLFRKTQTGDWTYKYINLQPYSESEGAQEEEDGVIFSKGVGKQETINNEEKNFESLNMGEAAKLAEREKSQKEKEKEKKPSRTFSSNFLKSSGGVDKK